MNWLKFFRIVLIIDSVVSVLKLALPIYLIGYGIQWQHAFDKKEKYHSSHLQQLIIILHFMASSFLLILILLRLVTNYYQYGQGYHKMEERSIWCSNGCCCRCCWFMVNILSIAFMLLSIWIRYSTSEWMNEIVSISCLCWDVVILCIAVIFRSMSKITHPYVLRYKHHNSTTADDDSV